jgi:hypothetical protein
MSKYLLSAAAAAFLMVGSTGAFALSNCTSGQVTAPGLVSTTGTGASSTTCYHGESGNVVDCTDPGNHVVVAETETFTIRTDPGTGNPICKVAGSESTSCDISRSMEVGSIDFEYCD